MSDEQKTVSVSVNIELQFSKIPYETDEEFEKRIRREVYYLDLKEVDYIVRIKELENDR